MYGLLRKIEKIAATMNILHNKLPPQDRHPLNQTPGRSTAPAAADKVSQSFLIDLNLVLCFKELTFSWTLLKSTNRSCSSGKALYIGLT